MGIFINMEISKSVTKEEWEKVYNETLLLVDKLPFAERISKSIHGIDTICLVRTKERTEQYGWNKEKSRTGWFADGDYTYMNTAEDHFLPRDLVEEDKVEPGAGDAILGNLAAYLDYGWNDDICSHTYGIWGAKTQGERYHMFLLAVACLIEARLGDKAFTHGDITRGQCRKAVEIVNKCLETPIEMPDRCYMDRLLNRVSKLPLSAEEKFTVFERLYLGTKDSEYGDFIRKAFPENIIDAYWKKEFGAYEVSMLGFSSLFHEYMTQGFGLEKLCGYVRLQDKDGQDKHENFVKRVMDAKLHLQEKNCADPLSIDQEAEGTYSIWTLFAQFGFAGARNKKIDRYIPIEEIRKALLAGLKNYDDVNQIIDEYLEKEAQQMEINLAEAKQSEEAFEQAVRQDASEVFNQIMDRKREKFEENQEKYDVSKYEDMKFYEHGNTMHPGLEKSLGHSRLFLDSLLEEDEFKALQKKTAQDRCRWLVEQNRYILIRDKDWEKIFTDIEENEESFGRYYSIMRVKMASNNLVDMSVGLMINDDLYAYSKTLANQAEEKEKKEG